MDAQSAGMGNATVTPPRHRASAIAVAAVVLGGAAMLSYRCSLKTTEQVPFTTMFIAGAILAAGPIGTTVYLIGDSAIRRVTATLVTVAATIYIATGAVGNLAMLTYMFATVMAVFVLLVGDLVAQLVDNLRSVR